MTIQYNHFWNIICSITFRVLIICLLEGPEIGNSLWMTITITFEIIHVLLHLGCYRKFAIDRPGGKQFLAPHNFWTTHIGIILQIYFDRKICILLEFNYIIVLRCVVQKLCVVENCLPHGLSKIKFKIKNKNF